MLIIPMPQILAIHPPIHKLRVTQPLKVPHDHLFHFCMPLTFLGVALANLMPFGYSLTMKSSQDCITELEKQIAELKARWPAHSVQPWLFQKIEDLEDELEALKSKELSDE
jgi:hypothetical protein